MKAALYISVLLAIAACEPKPDAIPRKLTAYDLLQDDTDWTLVSGVAFGPNYSHALSFIGSDGQIIHVYAEGRRDGDRREQQFYLQLTYNDPNPVEVLPGSTVEQRVLDLLASYQHRSYITIPDSYAKHFIAMLRDRRRPFPKDDEWMTPPK